MPRVLSAKCVRGLGAIASVVRAELNAGDRGYFDPSNGARPCDASNAQAAIEWIRELPQGRQDLFLLTPAELRLVREAVNELARCVDQDASMSPIGAEAELRQNSPLHKLSRLADRALAALNNDVAAKPRVVAKTVVHFPWGTTQDEPDIFSCCGRPLVPGTFSSDPGQTTCCRCRSSVRWKQAR